MHLYQAMEVLVQGRRNLRCIELTQILEQLGFEVRDGKRGGHKLLFHRQLSGFRSASFNCGHGKNPEIKPAYISNILRILQIYEAELKEYLGETHA